MRHPNRLTVLCLMILAYACTTALKAQAGEPLPIKIIELKGSATALLNDPHHTKKKLLSGDTLPDQSRVLLGPKSMMIVSLDKDVVAKLAAGADAEIKTVHATAKGHDWLIHLKQGVLAAAVRNPNQRPNHFQVRTTTATMGVRGTVFYVERLPGQPLFVCTCQGTVAFEDSNGKLIEQVTAKHHDRPLKFIEIPGTHTIKPEVAAMGDGHSDDDVVFLQNTLNHLE